MPAYKDEKQGTWFYAKTVTLPNGDTRQIKGRGFKTEGQALKAEAIAIENVAMHDGVSFEYVAKEYLKWYEKRRKKSSYNKIESILRVHLIPEFGDKAITAIRSRDVTRYQDDIIDLYAASHVKKLHTVLGQTFKFAIRQEYAKDNPATIAGNVDMEEDKHMNYWILDEFKEFIKHVDDPLYYALFMTLYYSGMRKGELLALTWGDVDFESNTINVDKTEYNRIVTTPKTPASRRKLYMPNHVMRLLDRLKTNAKPKMTYVVFGEYTESIPTSTLDRAYDKYIKASGVKRIRLHDFRHSHASYLINRDTIISVVAARLGHSDVATTLNTYSHLYPTTEKEAVLRMEDDFKPTQIIQFETK